MKEVDFSRPQHVHFMGIGGISMSGLAEILLDRGFEVSGSDNTPSDITKHLEERGARVFYPQKAENISDGIDLVVYTAAIHPDNPEYAACKDAGIPMMTRAEFLGTLMRTYPQSVAVAGTHGKTTTTGMIGEILLLDGSKIGKKPTISIGGILPVIRSNIYVGDSEMFLTEACEYTNSYHDFYPKFNVILNIEEDHMDFFSDLADVRRSFRRYAENTAADGTLVINGAIPDRKEILEGLECQILTFGDEACDYYAENVHVISAKDAGETRDFRDEKPLAAAPATVFSVIEKGQNIGEIRLLVPGRHNVGNALAAIAIARAMGIEWQIIVEALGRFTGIKRRFEYRGDVNGAHLYDDYAHHPTEIAASIAAARSLAQNRLVVVFQPHTYTRTKAFLEDFAEVLSTADVVGLCPVYPAREEDIYGVHSEDIAALIEKKMKEGSTECRAKECHCFADFDEAEKFLKKISSTGDLLITMGAGDVVKVADSLLRG
ncbi:MAG: UDP-N-acetylmuramate--L-alanine ligase [Lachnospiraceae bacterium]|nr:UDP-N-acetylmuramate--L-alanine ligase [Lachnospiraceae bacterium]